MEGLYLTAFQHKLLLQHLESLDLCPKYKQRIEIMLLADVGRSQSQICEALGCAQETARHWMTIAQSGLAHLWDDRPIGRPKKVNETYLQQLEELVSHSPKDYGYAFNQWTGQWLAKHLAKELKVELSSCHVNRLLKQMGLSTRSGQSADDVAESSISAALVVRDLNSASGSEECHAWSFRAVIGKSAIADKLHSAL